MLGLEYINQVNNNDVVLSQRCNVERTILAKRIGQKSLYYHTTMVATLYWSYETLIAVKVNDILHITTAKYSVTTSKHCSYLRNRHQGEVRYTSPVGLVQVLVNAGYFNR